MGAFVALIASGCAARSAPHYDLAGRGLRHAAAGSFAAAEADFITAKALSPPAWQVPDIGLAILREIAAGTLLPVAAVALFEGLHIDRCGRVIDLLGGDFGQRGCTERAHRKYSESIAMQSHAWSYTLRGIALYRLRRLSDAISDFDLAIAHDSTIALAWVNRGNAYDDTGRPDEARLDWMRAATLDPTVGVVAYTNLGHSHGRRSEFSAAAEAFTRVITLRPDWAEAYYFRSLAHHLAGDSDRARADAITALQLGHREAGALIDRINAGR